MFTSIILLIFLRISNRCSAYFDDIREDQKLNFTGFGLKYAGPIEEYDATTEDGYILKLFRIPGDQTRPVLLMHGLLCSSNDFIIRGNDSLAVTLKNAGYDVWFGNYRGNRHSRRHRTLNPDTDQSFWKFGPYEHAYYDLTTSIDFVLNTTGERMLSYIGHSEGVLIAYVLGSERPEYNEKFKVMIALAPACHIHYITARLPKILQLGKFLLSFLKMYDINELLGYDSVSGKMMRRFCTHSKVGIEMCRRLVLIASGVNPQGLEPKYVPIIFNNFPSGTSRMSIEHSIQAISSKKFGKFDYGPVKNLEKYKSVGPPDFDLKKVTMKIYIFAAENDRLSVLEDNSLQSNELPNVKDYIIVKDKLFNHMDFLWSRQSSKLVHPRILEILQLNK